MFTTSRAASDACRDHRDDTRRSHALWMLSKATSRYQQPPPSLLHEYFTHRSRSQSTCRTKRIAAMNATSTCADCGARVSNFRAHCNTCGIRYRDQQPQRLKVEQLVGRAADVLARSRSTVTRSNTALATLRRFRTRNQFALLLPMAPAVVSQAERERHRSSRLSQEGPEMGDAVDCVPRTYQAGLAKYAGRLYSITD
jgi:hypothetical protein